jgi:hypothetical protein
VGKLLVVKLRKEPLGVAPHPRPQRAEQLRILLNEPKDHQPPGDLAPVQPHVLRQWRWVNSF